MIEISVAQQPDRHASGYPLSLLVVPLVVPCHAGTSCGDATLARSVTLVEWGMPPAAVLRAATTVAADLINVTDRGRLAEGQLADIIAVPGNPLEDISVTQRVNFVMKGGKVFRNDHIN